MDHIYSKIIASHTGISVAQVSRTVELLREGATVPFISRYRKEATGGLDEVQIASISDEVERLSDVSKRKDTIMSTIEAQGKLTDQLRRRIDETWEMSVLEDIYLPYKPKRKTRAEVARQKGLEPLADLMMQQNPSLSVEGQAREFVSEAKGVASVEEAIRGAQDIIAERISEDEIARNIVRQDLQRGAVISAHRKAVSSRVGDEERERWEEGAAKYRDYFDFSEKLSRCASHRLLAMRRGEAEGYLSISINGDDERCFNRLEKTYVNRRRSEASELVWEAIEDGYKRLLKPSIVTEFAAASKQRADDEAIRIFVKNLEQLLMAAPLGQKRVMALDPGFRTGCKLVCLDAEGNLLCHDVIYPHPPRGEKIKSAERVESLIEQYSIEAISIGNGTASRETEDFVRKLDIPDSVGIYVVSEDGASIYSASKVARDEFPDEDVTVRGAVSIGRRLMDPLAELVKIDADSIGVGQYQKDVDQKKLRHSLDQTVVMCVNKVGVNLNTASKHLLTYVSGLGPVIAQNIVDYRAANGAFTSRRDLLKVPKLGPKAFEQAAGFLRVQGGVEPLDNSAVHPESYHIVESMAHDQGCTVAELMNRKDLRDAIDVRRYVTDAVGLPTLNDIMAELDKPGRDPRKQLTQFEFSHEIHELEDVREGMTLPGIVTNITNFGCFVDVGVHTQGLVHISEMADKYVKDPYSIVSLHQHVVVKVIDVDLRRRRLSLSLRL